MQTQRKHEDLDLISEDFQEENIWDIYLSNQTEIKISKNFYSLNCL